MDSTPETTVLSSAGGSEQIQLHHPSKTYTRQNVPGTPPAPNSPHLANIPGQQVLLDGETSELFEWTDGAERCRNWVVPAGRFLKKADFSALTNAGVNPLSRLATGTLLGTNRIVVRTEYVMPAPYLAPQAETDSSPTNIYITIASRLISITETSFPASEFEIPHDYKDMTGKPQAPSGPPPGPPPGLFRGTGGGIGPRNLDSLRNAMEKQKPLFSPPKTPPNPQ